MSIGPLIGPQDMLNVVQMYGGETKKKGMEYEFLLDHISLIRDSCTVRGNVVDAIGIQNTMPLVDSVTQLLAH